MRGVRLVATDANWTAGDGAEVRGPVSALLLLLTGRPAGLAQLHGDGVGVLAARLASDGAAPTPA
jgi:hypothetical protein